MSKKIIYKAKLNTNSTFLVFVKNNVLSYSYFFSETRIDRALNWLNLKQPLPDYKDELWVETSPSCGSWCTKDIFDTIILSGNNNINESKAVGLP